MTDFTKPTSVAELAKILSEEGRMFHPDDDPSDIEGLFTPEESVALTAKLKELRDSTGEKDFWSDFQDYQ